MAFESILICVPSTSHSVKSGTAIALASVTKALVESGRNVDFHNIDSAEIVTARDMFANMVLHSDRWDSLFFIDSDMFFSPDLVMRMIGLNEPVVGAAYIRRNLDLDRFAQGFSETGDKDVAIAQASKFNLIPSWEPGEAELEIRDGFASMGGVGMGCVLISRDVLLGMIEAQVVSPRLDLNAGPGKTCWSFFANLDHNGVRLGEDYSFCHRWTFSMGQRLWVCIDETLSHIGSFEYRARYVDLLKSSQAATPSKSSFKKTGSKRSKR